jgi:hypothetical protein
LSSALLKLEKTEKLRRVNDNSIDLQTRVRDSCSVMSAIQAIHSSKTSEVVL